MFSDSAISDYLTTIPEVPGVYQFFNSEGIIIYIGKARNLKKRVSSYFYKSHENAKLKILVSKIHKIEYIIVNNESDSLLLENNLIKQYKPKYNVLLKDDKTYPWLCIKKEPFPRVMTTRNYIEDGSQYFGPYASGKLLFTLRELIFKLFPIRTCSFNLTEENIRKEKFKVCLEFHIGNCLGPCIAKQNKDDYDTNIRFIREILKGNLSSVISFLRQGMQEDASNLEYEKAQQKKEKIEIIEKYQAKSIIVNPDIKNVDVFTIASDENAGYINYLKVVHGSVVQVHSLEYKKKLEETDEELLMYAIAEVLSLNKQSAEEIIIPFPIEEIGITNITIPKIGDKKKLLFLSQKNAIQFMRERQKMAENVDPERNFKRKLEQLQKDLHLSVLPTHIECFDNSNIQGEHAVSALVVFKNGKPAKKEYRHYNIRTVTGPDDYASMEEVVFRRYKRLLEESLSLPQLVIIDGGKGQLHSAVKSMEKLGIYGKFGIIGIAKNLEEIYFPFDSIPLYLDKKSESLRLIQQLRDEAHRFGISHHRKKREKSLIKTEIWEIQGIGEKSAEALLKQFISVKKLLDATEDEIAALIGKSKAKKVMEWIETKKP